jgi:hypothetical protein
MVSILCLVYIVINKEGSLHLSCHVCVTCVSKKKVVITLEQAMKALWGSRGIT